MITQEEMKELFVATTTRPIYAFECVEDGVNIYEKVDGFWGFLGKQDYGVIEIPKDQ